MQQAFIIGFMLFVILSQAIMVFIMWKRIPQDKAAVITGSRKKRIISGGGGLVFPLIERMDIISLESIKISPKIDNAVSHDGVSVAVELFALVKVKADFDSICSAMEQFFCGSPEKTTEKIATQSSCVLEGTICEYITKTTAEEINQNKDKFFGETQSNAAIALAKMGLEITAFTVTKIITK